MKTVAIISGGMDSTVLLHHLADMGDEIIPVSFNYGQRHVRELDFAYTSCVNLGLSHRVIDLRNLTKLLGGSSLTDSNIEVPDGHYAEETMKATVVPNRNMIMLSIAAGLAVAEKAQHIATAVHAGDHFIYPDCRPGFMTALSTAITLGNEGFGELGHNPLYTPFIDKTKADICKIGAELGVPFRYTWSCYKGTISHCGRCGTCVERKEAFRLAGVPDPTSYQDPDFEIKAFRGAASE